jgi:hypothetical protein
LLATLVAIAIALAALARALLPPIILSMLPSPSLLPSLLLATLIAIAIALAALAIAFFLAIALFVKGVHRTNNDVSQHHLRGVCMNLRR